MWSRSTDVVHGCLIGIAGSALRQILFVGAPEMLSDAYRHAVGELFAGGLSCAILFSVGASLRNRLRRETAVCMAPNLREFP